MTILCPCGHYTAPHPFPGCAENPAWSEGDCVRCEGTGTDPMHTVIEYYGDISRELPEPCASCRVAPENA